MPQGTVGPFFNDEFGDTYIAIYALSGDGYSYAQLKQYADNIRKRMLQLGDVEKVDFFGKQDEKIFIEFSDAKLANLKLDLREVAVAIQAQNALAPAGTLVSNSFNISLCVTGGLKSETELNNLPLRVANQNFRLGDLATVRRAYVAPPHV